jgi:predicted metalloprotease with PDZ domain
MKKLLSLFFIGLSTTLTAGAQNSYKYAVNLNNIQNDKLSITLLTPKHEKSTGIFAFPKIIPGTYSISNYGTFISDVKAFDGKGAALKVIKLNENQWKISGPEKLSKITYVVEDIFDTDKKHNIYPMAATNIESKNIVLNTPGFFGYLDGASKLPFEVSFEKPSNFYASTSLKPVSSTETKDIFKLDNVDELYDTPIMYGIPDTTSVKVGNCQVLVSVYSPNKLLNSKDIASWLSQLLDAAKNYLGGKLPADKYAFIYYFRDVKDKHSFAPGMGGALEHTTSSFYYLPELPAQQLQSTIVDISAHEFFHIITPLTIASREVKEFNFNEAVLSKHLWLYEGTTEYTEHHAQVKYGLNTPQEFLDKLSQKITNSRTDYNDTLAFTAMSKLAATKYESQYNNVYEKGALIGASLDLYLLHLSEGTYGLRNLTYDLGIRFGKKRYFNDEQLFDEIAELTYPEVKDFLVKYVSGHSPIPYEHFFGLAGVKFTPHAERKVVSFGGIALSNNNNGKFIVGPQSKINEFGLKLGYKIGDEIYAINGVTITPEHLSSVIDSVKRNIKEGDLFTVNIGRRNQEGNIDALTLSSPLFKVTEIDKNKLELDPNPTKKQMLIRTAWLTATKNSATKETSKAKAEDVASIDAIIKSVYDVISGPAGERDWNRFLSLFVSDAKMGVVVSNSAGEAKFHTMTPESYQKNNAPHFAEAGFYEEELGRKISEYGNIATVESAYQYRFKPKAAVAARGVNIFTLVKTNGRWWITNLMWQPESKEKKLPTTLLKKIMRDSK